MRLYSRNCIGNCSTANASESQMLTMAENPVKMSIPILGGEGLGRAMATAGKRNSAA